MASIAFVLGAGGVVGAAYHAGALAAIAEVTGFDARGAQLLVGTSAGAGFSASLRMGFSPGDMLARATGLEVSDEAQRLVEKLPRGRLDSPTSPSLGSWLVPQAPWLLVPALLSRGGIRPGLAAAGCMPRGTVDSALLGDRVRAILGDRWPEQPTWICAARLRDGKRVVFGRDDVAVTDLGTAVQASSAVPGHFRPVKIGDREYIDGGAWSPTNADLVAGLGFDLVLVVSPMSAVKRALGPPISNTGRSLHARMLASEVGRIRGRGSPVIAIQPTASALEAMDKNPPESTKAPPVARQAHDEVAALLERGLVADRVEILREGARTLQGTWHERDLTRSD